MAETASRRDLSGTIWLASLFSILAVIALLICLAHPALFLWFAAVAFLLVTGAVWVWGYGVWDENRRLAADLEQLVREHASCPAPVVELLPSDFTERMIETTRAHLRSVPTQRTGHEPWPPVARAVEAEATPVHDGLVVGGFMEWVEAWGNDVGGAS